MVDPSLSDDDPPIRAGTGQGGAGLGGTGQGGAAPAGGDLLDGGLAAGGAGDAVPVADAALPPLDLPPVEVPAAPMPAADAAPGAGEPGGTGPAGSPVQPMALLRDVPMDVTAELGRTRMTVSNLLNLVPGSIVELDRAAGAPVDLLVNGALIARGEVVVIDEEFGVRINEIVSQDRSVLS